MRVGYLIDTNVVGPDRRPLTPAQTGAAMEAMVQEGLLAEAVGFHSVHVPDRHRAPACVFPAPEQLLTLLARETARVMLGSFTFVATLVHPMKAAEQFAVIDQLSGGRLVTTVSRGFLPAFWGQFGIPEDRMLGRFRETLRVWETAFAGEPFDHDGVHWQVRDGLLAPAPAQAGGWPLWAGATRCPPRSGAAPSTPRPGPAIRCPPRPRRSRPTRRPTATGPPSWASARSWCSCATGGSPTAWPRPPRSSASTTRAWCASTCATRARRAHRPSPAPAT
ncbi:LLM class flavin-dependent oxidoreductase [Baekduia soli]|uniref:LLM class flavin-dependent oxidoreductase n=1 Tax=Baekduia soli TaxID=496014 RepID=A0A5B8UBJ2_9ACTN|nr:LLM class flavin-dependent oxidoreductase [Baekduia soli]